MSAPAVVRPIVDDPLASAAGWLELALTSVGGVLDRLMLAGMRLAFAEAIRPEPDVREALAETARPYLDDALRREPRRFFAFLDAPQPRVTVRTLAERSVRGGVVAVREFASDYTPWHASDSWPACAENERIPVQHWVHRRDRARAVIVALHGFTMGRPWIDAQVLMAAQWFARGYDVVLPVLPLHGARSPRWARYSGEAFASWDVGRLNEAVRQSVHDVAIVRRWLLAQSPTPVGLVGLSLGGYVTALMAGLCADLAFAVPVAAPASLAWLPQRLFGFGGLVQRPPPIAARTLDAAYRVHSPLAFRRAIARRRIVLVGGLGDGVVPPEQVRALWRHWNEPALHWFTGGHATPFGRSDIMARIDAHLRELD